MMCLVMPGRSTLAIRSGPPARSQERAARGAGAARSAALQADRARRPARPMSACAQTRLLATMPPPRSRRHAAARDRAHPDAAARELSRHADLHRRPGRHAASSTTSRPRRSSGSASTRPARCRPTSGRRAYEADRRERRAPLAPERAAADDRAARAPAGARPAVIRGLDDVRRHIEVTAFPLDRPGRPPSRRGGDLLGGGRR